MDSREQAARARDVACPEDLPEHWAAPNDRRYLLQLVDSLRERVAELEAQTWLACRECDRNHWCDAGFNHEGECAESLELPQIGQDCGI